MKRKLLSAVLLSAGLIFGCGGEEEESVDVEGCEHLQRGPASSITATATATGAPAVKDDHRRYDIALADVTGGKGGSVTFAAAAAGDYVLFTSADVPVAVTDANGQAVAIEASVKSSPECTEIKGRHTIPMKVGTHTLTFGPTTGASVSIVIEPDEHGEHEH
jgi:hypothetical protein